MNLLIKVSTFRIRKEEILNRSPVKICSFLHKFFASNPHIFVDRKYDFIWNSSLLKTNLNSQHLIFEVSLGASSEK